MKQNKYDNNDFFKSYGEMPRSVEGLNAAGEWYVLREMLPDFKGRNVLDLGCGYGWHCIYAKAQGAENVTGVDLSEKMIARAKENSKGLTIDYKQLAIEDMDFEPEKFDIVISSLAFHYIKDLEVVFRKINRVLKKGGTFVFSMEHPVFTSRAEQDWFTDKNGNRLHWPIDNYQDEGKRQARFLGHQVIKYHRTLETIINTTIASDFCIQQISEPKPSDDFLKNYPEMKDEMRRPIFIIIAAIKK
ncbi:class I SAM-dependent methyltransferase [Sinomicrobium weinanense]|uniref:Class I SAM-dependent methyltransferase n=1 Tax=Sinomicrobium weinanense TaxID=2842200 RepID=A0A926JP36_9FLAO|nr:class I SAM-dependent methyltransferase [Sinomicrobium weinanense]MBC9794880.1 class I SAM-dependent methyltransferase [Sinomicrobium weinanense]MBU3125651.1 class I SAM-dependent methyltransferase [Sinomicrobium weinanense]